MSTLLVVEDSPDLLAHITGSLTAEGYRVLTAGSAAEMGRRLVDDTPALILLDVNLPDADGIELARSKGLGQRGGLIFITSRDTPEDVIAGLDAGGDDYVTKPVMMPALLARIRSVLRRRKDNAAETLLTFDGWILDLIRRELFSPKGNLLPLTAGEFNVLAALAAAKGHPVDRDFLLDVISNRDPREVSGHTVDTLIARLRRKMRDGGGPVPIVTLRNQGYALRPQTP
ncbi:MAG TPA: response regulator transcription factor [Candidatus Sulfotelmatobacter sp.]|jgi:two-component system torCAD operon response regulator TorR|nr:response regulator transcription factor [Candidatus Sulfotelmatobacter sp.]